MEQKTDADSVRQHQRVSSYSSNILLVSITKEIPALSVVVVVVSFLFVFCCCFFVFPH